MALYDHRVFRCGNDWWVGQVHTASGADYGNLPVTLTSESVIFSCLTQTELRSRWLRLRANTLNKLSHGSVCAILDRAKHLDHRFKMSPINAPNAAEGGNELTDDEGLRWSVRTTNAVASTSDVVPGIEFTCLDDSALRFIVTMRDVEESDHLLRSADSLVGLVQTHRRTLESVGIDDEEPQT